MVKPVNVTALARRMPTVSPPYHLFHQVYAMSFTLFCVLFFQLVELIVCLFLSVVIRRLGR
jgi:hypothetical protein